MKLLIKFVFKVIIPCLVITSSGYSVMGQNIYPQGYFGSPLSIPLSLSGNFGEIRSNHYHSGLDFKTDSVIGKEVYATADGFISRIKVNSSGFGKALYLTHPNGYVTVYGHLHHFIDTINNFVEIDQYKKESFETEIFPDTNQFPIKKGDLIAWSGNTGGSEGPHLHYEIRDSKTEKPINPLLFGYDIKDTIAPILESIHFHPLVIPELRNQFPDIDLKLSKTTGITDTIRFIGKFGVEFKGFDLANDEPNHIGIYNISLYLGDSLIFNLKRSSFEFDETRFVNAHINYSKKFLENETFERCYRLPGDSFSLTQNILNDGSLSIDSGKSLQLLLELEDYNKNKTKLNIIIQGLREPVANNYKIEPIKSKNDLINEKSILAKWNKKTTFRNKFIYLKIPENALYQNELIRIGYEKRKKPKSEPTYLIGDGTIPLRFPVTISLKLLNIADTSKNKTVLVKKNNNNTESYVPSVFKGDSITALVRTFGRFSISMDTTSPQIDHYKIDYDSIFNKQLLMVRISDNLSGIASYRGTLNGHWILMELDEKTSTLFYTFNNMTDIENKILHVEVIDKKQNTGVYEVVIK